MKKIFAVLMLSILCACYATGAGATAMRLTVPETSAVGQPFFLTLRVNEDIGDVTVKWRGKEFVFKPKLNTVRTILGAPNDSKLIGETIPVVVEFDCGDKGRIQAEREIKIVGYDYPRQELKVAPEMVTPPKSVSGRISNENKAISNALAKAMKTKGGALPTTYTRPGRGIPTAYFGGFRVYNGQPRSGHGGVDLRSATGNKVNAPTDGTVILTGEHYFAGGSVYIDHGGGVVTAYFHLSKILVKEGQRVKTGDVIALSGATGRVTGPHLHFGLYAAGAWLDPLPLIDTKRRQQETEYYYEF